MTAILEAMYEAMDISIHIPRVGDDVSTVKIPIASISISIHIPRVGDDIPADRLEFWGEYFNPHPPCGG